MNLLTRTTAAAGLVMALTAAGAGTAHATATYVPGGTACAAAAMTADAGVRAAATRTRNLTVAGLARSATAERAAVIAAREADNKEAAATLYFANTAAAGIADPAKANAVRSEALNIYNATRTNIYAAATNDLTNIATDVAVHTQKANAFYYQRVTAAAGLPGQIRCTNVVSAAVGAYDRTMARVDRSYDISVAGADAAKTARLSITSAPALRNSVVQYWAVSRRNIEAARVANYRTAKVVFEQGLRDGAAASL